MNTKHTPGPWKAKQSFGHNGEWVVLWEDRSKSGVHSRRIDSNGRFTESDARLIAASPELLEALEGLADDYAKLFEAYQKATGEKAFGWGLFPVEIAREAIKKARGTHEE